MRYTLAPKIKCDLEDIADWISQDSPTRAVATVKELRAEFRQIAQNPMLYQLRPTLAKTPVWPSLVDMLRCFGSMATW